MAANSSVIILILALIMHLTTETSSSLFDLVLRPIADEVSNAVANSDLSEETKVAFSKQYVNVGRYSNDLIELLNSYMTIHESPIRFNDDEKRILTSSYTEDSLNAKIHAQLKYFRKVQEVQCTDYVLLLYKLYGTKRNTKHIAKHVYNMIAMAFEGKAVVHNWLWKLHISLWEPTMYDHEVLSLKLMEGIVRDLEQFRTPLTDMVSICVDHEYTSNILNLHNPKYRMMSAFAYDQIGYCFMFNNEKHTNYRNEKPALPLTVKHLFLMNIWPISYNQSLVHEPIAYVTIKWTMLAEKFGVDFQNVYKQFTVTRDWAKDPFKYITFQQTFVNLVRIKLYCFIFMELIAYQKVDDSLTNKYLYRHNSFRRKIADIVKLIYVEDTTLNLVLTLYSAIRKSNKEQIEEILKIITDEVTNILTTLINCPSETSLADISNVDLDRDIRYYLFMVIFEKQCDGFFKTLKGKLKGLTFDVLLFFIDGSKNTDLIVFPEN